MRAGVPVDAGTLIAVQEEAGWRVGTLDDLGENFRPDQQLRKAMMPATRQTTLQSTYFSSNPPLRKCLQKPQP